MVAKWKAKCGNKLTHVQKWKRAHMPVTWKERNDVFCESVCLNTCTMVAEGSRMIHLLRRPTVATILRA